MAYYSDNPFGRSPRRELQGLRVHKDSHKIKKSPQTQPPSRAPVIIYEVLPTIIHANPSDFKELVQRLTGFSPSSNAPSNYNPPLQNNIRGAISPLQKKIHGWGVSGTGVEVGGFEMPPGPALLPPIPPFFFSPRLPDPSQFSIFNDSWEHEFSRRYSFMPGPSTFLSTRITSPTPSIDQLINNFFGY